MDFCTVMGSYHWWSDQLWFYGLLLCAQNRITNRELKLLAFDTLINHHKLDIKNDVYKVGLKHSLLGPIPYQIRSIWILVAAWFCLLWPMDKESWKYSKLWPAWSLFIVCIACTYSKGLLKKRIFSGVWTAWNSNCFLDLVPSNQILRFCDFTQTALFP